jgi:hypothetical protein
MRNTPLTRHMPKSWASIVMTCWLRNPTPVSRRLKLRICWSEAVPLTSW